MTCNCFLRPIRRDLTCSSYTLPFKMVITFVCLVSVFLLLSSMAVFYHVNYSLQRACCKLCMGFTCTCCGRILSWAKVFNSIVSFFLLLLFIVRTLSHVFHIGVKGNQKSKQQLLFKLERNALGVSLGNS